MKKVKSFLLRANDLLRKYFFQFCKDIIHVNKKYEEGDESDIGEVVDVKPVYPRIIYKTEYEEDLVYPFNKRGDESDEKALKRAENTFNFVVETRRFEIEMYWKRATYFWAFIAIIFAGYVALVRTGNSSSIEAFLLICVGFVVSLAWHLTNKGSKTWQRHWEKHLDLLEDEFVGPLYKTVNKTKTYSVSKINEIVSFVFVSSWVVLYFHHLAVLYSPSSKESSQPAGVLMFLITVGVILAASAMVFGKGRGRFDEQEVKMFRRSYRFPQSSTDE